MEDDLAGLRVGLEKHKRLLAAPRFDQSKLTLGSSILAHSLFLLLSLRRSVSLRLSGTNVNTNNKDHTYYSTRRFKPNVKRLVHHSEVLGAGFRMQTTTKALREIKRYGGFDNYLVRLPHYAARRRVDHAARCVTC